MPQRDALFMLKVAGGWRTDNVMDAQPSDVVVF